MQAHTNTHRDTPSFSCWEQANVRRCKTGYSLWIQLAVISYHELVDLFRNYHAIGNPIFFMLWRDVRFLSFFSFFSFSFLGRLWGKNWNIHVVLNCKLCENRLIHKISNKPLSDLYFSAPLHPFPPVKQTSRRRPPCVFDCLVQHETGAAFAPSGDKGPAMITISASDYESDGHLITPPTSRRGWLPPVWRLSIGRLSQLWSGPATTSCAPNVGVLLRQPIGSDDAMEANG